MIGGLIDASAIERNRGLLDELLAVWDSQSAVGCGSYLKGLISGIRHYGPQSLEAELRWLVALNNQRVIIELSADPVIVEPGSFMGLYDAFVAFLDSRGCLAIFRENVSNRQGMTIFDFVSGVYHSDVSAACLVSHAFPWAEDAAKLGDDFWGYSHCAWVDRVREGIS